MWNMGLAWLPDPAPIRGFHLPFTKLKLAVEGFHSGHGINNPALHGDRNWSPCEAGDAQGDAVALDGQRFAPLWMLKHKPWWDKFFEQSYGPS